MTSVPRVGNALAVASTVAAAAVGYHLPSSHVRVKWLARGRVSFAVGSYFAWGSYFDLEFAAVARDRFVAFVLWLLRRPLRSILRSIRGLKLRFGTPDREKIEIAIRKFSEL